ncbi:hypothetical protein C2W62_40705, partial [Candidatus Entotheonella serta]
IALLRERPERLQSGINHAYGNAIAWTLRHRWWVVSAAFVVFIVSLSLFINVLLPNRDDTRTPRRDMYIRVKADHSVPFTKIVATMTHIEDILLSQRDQLEIRHVSTSFSESGRHDLRVFFRELDESRTSTEELQEQLLAVLPERAGIEYRVARGRGVDGNEIGIAVQIQGPHGEVLAHMARTVKNHLKGIEGVFNVETDVDRDEDERDATFTLGLAIALIYIIMAALFESIVMPLAIMLTVPFALSGVVFVFTITGTNLNQMADLGLLILCGLVVNNGIILVDATNQLRASGTAASKYCGSYRSRRTTTTYLNRAVPECDPTSGARTGPRRHHWQWKSGK